MKLIRGLVLVMITCCGSAGILAETLVDTNFKQVDREGHPEAGSPKKAPLEKHSGIQLEPPSTITGGTEPAGDLPPPYALFKIHGREADAEVPANARLIWDLKSLPPVNTGVIVITYTAVILEPTPAGGRFMVNFDTESGTSPEGRLHPSQRPLIVLCKGETVTSNTKGASVVSVGTEKAFTVMMTCDLDKKTWSATVNGKKILGKTSFTEEFELIYQKAKVRGLEFGSIAGEGHQPEGKFAITDVKMEWNK